MTPCHSLLHPLASGQPQALRCCRADSAQQPAQHNQLPSLTACSALLLAQRNRYTSPAASPFTISSDAAHILQPPLQQRAAAHRPRFLHPTRLYRTRWLPASYKPFAAALPILTSCLQPQRAAQQRCRASITCQPAHHLL